MAEPIVTPTGTDAPTHKDPLIIPNSPLSQTPTPIMTQASTSIVEDEKPAVDSGIVETVRQSVKDMMHDDEIVNIMNVTLSEKVCRSLIAQIKEEEISLAAAQTTPPAVIENILPVTKIEPADPFQHTNLILCADGMNQYTPVPGKKQSVSACAPLACSFLASDKTSSSEMIQNLILANTYTDDLHSFADEWLPKFHLEAPEDNPWPFQQPFYGAIMAVSFEQVCISPEGNDSGLIAAVKTLVENPHIRGAILNGNGITTAIRKKGDYIEFFDSHGDSTITKADNSAYIKGFKKDQQQGLVDLLRQRYPNMGQNYIEVLPIRFSN